MRMMAAIVVLVLGGCTYTEVEYGDARLKSWRLWTATAANVEAPDFKFGYSSDPDAAAMQASMAMNQQLLQEVLSVGRLAATP